MNQPAKSVWTKSGEYFNLTKPDLDQMAELPMGVYLVQMGKSGLFLERRGEGFTYPAKMYAIEEEFINRVTRTFHATTGNMGVLLTGIRGTGKTVTAEKLAEKIGLPIILVSQDMPGLVDFIDSFPHPGTFLFDEFEKVFSAGDNGDNNRNGVVSIGGQQERGQAKLLPLMDGVMNGANRKVFLLTTNRTMVDQNLLQRPGRVRYIKEFGNLKKETIETIVRDQLCDLELFSEVVDFIAQLEIITIDIVTSVVNEMNIHGGQAKDLEGIFNVRRLNRVTDVIIMDTHMEEQKRHLSANLHPETIKDEHVGHDLFVNRTKVGKIAKIDGRFITVDRTELLAEYEDEDISHTRPFFRLETWVLELKSMPSYNQDSFKRGYAPTSY
jgi:SpoVK/Ycf46/Vps4 family AAA+-type ATPase